MKKKSLEKILYAMGIEPAEGSDSCLSAEDMERVNKFSSGVFSHVSGFCASLLILFVFIMNCLRGHMRVTRLQSILVFASLVIILAVMDKLSFGRFFAGPMHTVANILLAAEIYCIWAHYDYLSKSILLFTAVGIAAALAYTAVHIKRLREKRNGQIAARITLSALKKSLALCLAPLLVMCVFFNINFRIILSAGDPAEYSAAETGAGGLATYEPLAQDWEKKSPEEKYGVILEICSDQAEKLGVSCPPVSLSELDWGTVGGYHWDKGTIDLDYIWIRDHGFYDAAEICCHEMYHAYQQKLTNLYEKCDDDEKKLAVFRINHVAAYSAEFENYSNPAADLNELSDYYGQALEIDAENYAIKQLAEMGITPSQK